ncbi:MAG: 4'-phosphopantetheinyl transferase superfamily protein [bacterium]
MSADIRTFTVCGQDGTPIVFVDVVYDAGPDTVRELLAARLNTPVSQIEIRYDSWGQPSLAGDDAPAISISHAGPLLAVAHAHAGKVGVDIEVLQPDIDVAALAENFCTPAEQGLLNSTPPESQAAAFSTIWTLKEAYQKAIGLGMAVDMCSIETKMRPGGIHLQAVHGSTELACGWQTELFHFHWQDCDIVLAVVVGG